VADVLHLAAAAVAQAPREVGVEADSRVEAVTGVEVVVVRTDVISVRLLDIGDGDEKHQGMMARDMARDMVKVIIAVIGETIETGAETTEIAQEIATNGEADIEKDGINGNQRAVEQFGLVGLKTSLKKRT